MINRIQSTAHFGQFVMQGEPEVQRDGIYLEGYSVKPFQKKLTDGDKFEVTTVNRNSEVLEVTVENKAGSTHKQEFLRRANVVMDVFSSHFALSQGEIAYNYMADVEEAQRTAASIHRENFPVDDDNDDGSRQHTESWAARVWRQWGGGGGGFQPA